jgi:predicted HTH transcriptional regulator
LLLRPDLPPFLDDLIMRLLSKVPGERPEDAIQVRDALLSLAPDTEADPDIGALIATGEGQHVEFKASFRTPSTTLPPDLSPEKVAERRKQEQKLIEAACIAALAGFMNSEGGWLLIGVEDDGSIAGIESDYTTMKSQHRGQPKEDLWENCFRDALTESLGTQALANISVGFTAHPAGTVAVVHCKRGAKPTWVKKTDFVIRTGNRTQKVAPEDAMEYIGQRWLAKP